MYWNLPEKIQLWKSKMQLKFADTQLALKLLFLYRSLNDCYEWTLRNKIIHREVSFWKFIWKPRCFCTQMKFAYSSIMCPFKLTTKLSWIWACFLASADQKVNNTMLIDKFTFQTDLLFYKKHTKCTLNLRSLDFPSADSICEETVINSSRANLSLDLLSFSFKTAA